MIHFADICFAAVDAVNAYRDGFYGNSGSGMTRKVIIGALIVGGIWAILFVMDRIQKKRRGAETEERVLFNDLCAVHQLNANEKKRVEAATRKAQVEPMEAIFVMPEVFDRVVAADRDPSSWAPVRKKLYGEAEVA